MAARNSMRRPRQTVLVILGLLVGTSIISGALVTGDSMEYAIVEASYDAFQGIDETVFIDGFNFFPSYVADELGRHPRLSAQTDGVGRNILWSTAVTDEASRQYEPVVHLVGFDPQEDPAFGRFDLGDADSTGAQLADDEVYLNDAAADRLDARIGDRLTLNFTLPIDPILPSALQINDTVGPSARPPPTPLPLPVPPATDTPKAFDVPIDSTVVRLTVALLWDSTNGPEDLDLELIDEQGRVAASNLNGTTNAPDGPLVIINQTGTLSSPLAKGTWRVRVSTDAAAQAEPFTLLILRFEPVYEFDEYEQRLNEFRSNEFTRRFVPDPQDDDARLVSRESRTVTVAGIMEGGRGPNFKLPTPFSVFVRLAVLQDWLGREGEVNVVTISNIGDVEEGADRTPDVFPSLLGAALNDTKRAHPDDPPVLALRINNDKVFWLEQAERVGEVFSVFLTFISSFSVIAGLLLIVNIFTMLAEERKTELGLSRAVGLTKGHLANLFLLEGALYALPAAAIGTFAGLLLALGLIAGFNAFGDPLVFPAVPYRIEGASLLLAWSIGLLLTLGTVYVAARRVARINVVRAIRNLEEPERGQGTFPKVAGPVIAVAATLLTIASYIFDSFPLQVLGPGLLAIGAGLTLRRWFVRRLVYPPIALLLFLYYAITVYTIQRYDTVEGNTFGPLRAVLMAICVVVIAVYTETLARRIGSFLSRFRALRAVARPAVSYPLYRKFRTGLTLAMFSVILLVVTMFSIFGALFQPDPSKESGGYDVEGVTQSPPVDLAAQGRPLPSTVEHYDALPYYQHYGGTLVRVNNQTPGHFGPPQDRVFGIDASFARENRFTLLDRDARYATDAEAYAALANSNDLVIVAYPYSTDEDGNEDEHHVGDSLTIESQGGRRSFTIIGIQDQIHYEGIFVSQDALGRMFSNVDALYLIRLYDSDDALDTARRLEADFRDLGMDASSIRQEVLDESQSFRQIFTLIQLFLGLGLIVGILSLGIVTARGVIERRQEIGMLRALGFRPKDVGRVFLIETLTIVGMGVLIGTFCAIVVSYGLYKSQVEDLDIPYTIPWIELAVIAAIAFAATLLSTIAPIRRASRTPPADALRYIE